jgi:uncharacterized protein (DUF983 family)
MNPIPFPPAISPIDIDMIWRPRFVMPGLWLALRRGAAGRCPCCGIGRLFSGYLKPVATCAECHIPLGSVPSDDIPPYFTVLLAGHLMVPLLVLVETTMRLPMGLEIGLFLALTAALVLSLLRPVKGAVIGWLLQQKYDPRASDA